MNKQPTFSYLWPTLFGTFYNPDHENMKKDLLKFFEEYKKKNPSRKSGENHKLYESKYDLHSQQGTVFQKLLKNFITKAFFEIESLKISVRDITANDIETRKLNKNLKGVVITYISNKSPVASYLQVGDIILEVQKNKILNSRDFNTLIENIYKKGEKTILLAIINKNNQRRYLGVKTKYGKIAIFSCL